MKALRIDDRLDRYGLDIHISATARCLPRRKVKFVDGPKQWRQRSITEYLMNSFTTCGEAKIPYF